MYALLINYKYIYLLKSHDCRNLIVKGFKYIQGFLLLLNKN